MDKEKCKRTLLNFLEKYGKTIPEEGEISKARDILINEGTFAVPQPELKKGLKDFSIHEKMGARRLSTRFDKRVLLRPRVHHDEPYAQLPPSIPFGY